MVRDGPVLVSWVAVNNDPYEERRDGLPTPGPTLTLLFDDNSEFCGTVRDVVLLTGEPSTHGEKERRATARLKQAICDQDADIHVEIRLWRGDDPTDHDSVFRFVSHVMPAIRKKYAGRELIVHVSPGTPTMQTIWVLMGETGMIEPPFRLVKSYRRHERRGRPVVVPVRLEVDTFYKAYRAARPHEVSSEEQAVSWRPERFRGDTMRNLFRDARRFAQVKVPVLLLGERGTGKTTIAGWIRSNSPFRNRELDKDWPAVACGQYSSELLRSELFGYVKNAFTGAEKDRDGLLAKADGDTLFLDEIGDLTYDNQRRIIKAIEEQTYHRVGDTKSQTSDFRLLTATNRDMDELRQLLHLDLLDRISHLTLRLPPLREITEELDWLWDAIYDTAADRAGVDKSRAQLGDADHGRVVDALKRHPLPGNMRDLFCVAYRVLAARGDVDEPLSPGDAVDFGLETLAEPATSVGKVGSRAVARAFADDATLALQGKLETKVFFRNLRAYLAAELRRRSKDTGRPIAHLCDVTERTLLTWTKGSEWSEE